MEYRRFKQHDQYASTTVVVPGNKAYGVTSAAPVGWWKQDTLIGTSNLAAVTSWTDSSSSGWTQTTETIAPTWDSTTLGGCISCTATANGRLANTAFNSLNGVTGFTAFIVMAVTGGGGSIAGANNFGGAAAYYSSPNLYHYVGSANSGGYAYTTAAAGHVFEQVFDGTQAGNTTRLVALLDGVAQTLTFGGTIPTSTGAVANGYGIGRIYTGDATESNTNIAEVLIYAKALSSADRSTIRVALGSKYTITVTP